MQGFWLSIQATDYSCSPKEERGFHRRKVYKGSFQHSIPPASSPFNPPSKRTCTTKFYTVPYTMSDSSLARVPYHIQSKNTLFYVISTPQDKADQEVDTKPGKDSIPPNAVCARLSTLSTTNFKRQPWFFFGQILTLNPPVRGPVTLNVLIQGASGLFVSLKVSLYHLHKFYNNHKFTNAGLRVMKRKPSLLGPKSHTPGQSVWLHLRHTCKSAHGLKPDILFISAPSQHYSCRWRRSMFI